MGSKDRGRGFFARLFGGAEPEADGGDEADHSGYAGNLQRDGTRRERVALHTKDGATLWMEPEHWARSLPAVFERCWNHADALYSTIIDAVQKGYAAEAVAAARRLREIDADPERAVVVLAIVLTRVGELDEAEHLLGNHAVEHGRSGVVPNNLAKVHAERGDSARAEKLLWEALVADPNLTNSVEWWRAIHRERGGDAGMRAALEEIAALPGSWRAKVWLARMELEAGRAEGAVRLYEEVMSSAARDANALMQISGDLGLHGRVEDAVRLVRPHYRPSEHGPAPGVNLAQAYIALKRRRDAEEILDALDRLERYDWKQHFDALRAEAAKLA